MSPVATAPAHLRARDAAAARGRTCARCSTLLYPPPCRHRRRPPARRSPSTWSCRTPAGRGCWCRPRSRRVAAAAVRRYAEPQSPDRQAQARRGGGRAAQRRVRRCCCATGSGCTGPAGESIDGYLREALGPSCRAQHPHRTGAGQPQAGAAADQPGRRHGRLRQARHRAADPAAGAGRDGGAHRAGARRARPTLTVPTRAARRAVARPPGAGPVALPVWQPRAPLTAAAAGRARCATSPACCGTSTGRLVDQRRTGPSCASGSPRVADRPDGAALAAAAARPGRPRPATPTCATAPGTATGRRGTWPRWPTRCWSGTGSGSPSACRSASTRCTTSCSGGSRPTRTRPAPSRRTVTPGAGGCSRRSRCRRGRAELTALLYLVDLAARYLADRQAEAGARLGVLGTWLLPGARPPRGGVP